MHCLDKVFQLAQTSEGPEFEHFARHVDALEDIAQLLGPRQGISMASKARKLGVDFIKGHAVATIIAVVGPKGQFAVRKDVGNNLCDVSDLVVCLILANVKDLVMHKVSRGREATGDRLADIEDMN